MIQKNIRVAFIELVETTEFKHEEEQIFGETYPFYPTYKAGDTLFIEITERGKINPPLKLTQYRIIDVHHVLSARRVDQSKYADVDTFAKLTVYLRKLE